MKGGDAKIFHESLIWLQTRKLKGFQWAKEYCLKDLCRGISKSGRVGLFLAFCLGIFSEWLVLAFLIMVFGNIATEKDSAQVEKLAKSWFSV